METENRISFPSEQEPNGLTQWHTATFLLAKEVRGRDFQNPMPYNMQRRAKAAGEFLYRVREIALDICFWGTADIEPSAWVQAIVWELIKQDLGPADHSLMSGKSADKTKYSPDTAFGLLIVLAVERAKMSKDFKVRKLKPLLDAWTDTNKERSKYFSGPKAVLRRNQYQHFERIGYPSPCP